MAVLLGAAQALTKGQLWAPRRLTVADPLRPVLSRWPYLLMTSWLLSICAVLPLVLTFFAYWRGLHRAQRLLPKERRLNGDVRVVPDLYNPGSSHRWLAILIQEKTGRYSPRLRHAIAQARWSIVLLPFAVGISAVLLGYVPRGEEALPARPSFVVSLPR